MENEAPGLNDTMIPIRNLYYLFLYAWGRFSEGRRVEVGSDVSPDLPNLLAKVLAFGVRGQIGRGLHRGYAERVEELALPRGKFLLQDTVKRSSLASGRAVCQFDELSTDTLPNRIIKSTIRHLRLSAKIDLNLAAELRRLEGRMEGVARVRLKPELFRLLQVSRSHGQYAFLMDVCRLVMELSLPHEDGTGHRFYDVLEDEVRMSAVFEQFIRNFYRHEQDRYSVAAEAIAWPAVCEVPGNLGYLPNMITDVTLRSPDRTIIIDAKFYKQTFTIGHFSEHPKIRSGHLYQLQSYLEHTFGHATPGSSEGILLYPSTNGQEISLNFQLPRHRIRVCTVDLNRSWRDVHNQLLALIHLLPAE